MLTPQISAFAEQAAAHFIAICLKNCASAGHLARELAARRHRDPVADLQYLFELR
jgi:hypothetical protein